MCLDDYDFPLLARDTGAAAAAAAAAWGQSVSTRRDGGERWSSQCGGGDGGGSDLSPVRTPLTHSHPRPPVIDDVAVTRQRRRIDRCYDFHKWSRGWRLLCASMAAGDRGACLREVVVVVVLVSWQLLVVPAWVPADRQSANNSLARNQSR